MKQILTTMLLAVASLLTFGQGSITASGNITYASTGLAVTNLNYTITVIDSNGLVTHTGVTDNYGSFYDTINLTSMLGQFPVMLEFNDCNGTTYSDSLLLSPGTWHAFFDSALYCQSSIPCDPTFTTTVLNDTVVIHEVTNPYPGSVYNWTLPNGSVASDTLVTYILNNYNSNYAACLDVYNTTAGCTDSICNSFTAGVPPTPVGCDPTFTTSVVNDTVVTHTIINPLASSTYDWTLSNGTIFSGSTVTYTVNTYGQYFMCVSQSDSLYSCLADTCVSFTAGIPPTSSCDPTFTTSVVNDTVVTHTITNPSSGNSYLWFLADGSVATTSSITYIVDNYSTSHFSCVTVTSSSGTCVDSLCNSFTAGVPTTPAGCDPTFTTSVVNDTVVTHTVTNPSANDYHYWILPNGSTSSNTTVTYTLSAYDSAYSACLIVGNTAANCSDTLCDMFSAGVIPVVPPGDIYGTISVDNSSAGDAIVYLIDLVNDSSGIILVAIDSTTTTTGNYSFSNVAPGNYYVKAALSASNPLYYNYMPSYYANNLLSIGALHWTNAATVTVAQSSSAVNVSFSLIPGINAGGPGFIGGLVSQGANKTAGAGNPLEGVLVILLNENDVPVAYTNSNAQGEFEFDNLSHGTYKVYAEVAGIPTTPVVYTIDSDNESTDLIRVEVNSTYVDGYIASPSSTNDLTSTTISVYPNPINDVVTIQVIDEIGETANISIINMNGQIVLQETVVLAGSTVINTSDISKGYYLMDIQIGDHSSFIKVVK